MKPFTPHAVSMGTEIPPTPLSLSRRSSRQLRRVIDSLATVVITVGGLMTILSILGIFAYLFIEVAPLFYAASAKKVAAVSIKPFEVDTPQSWNLGVGLDEYMEVAYVVQATGVSLYRVPSGEPFVLESIPTFEPGQISAIGRSLGKSHIFGLGTREGQVIPLFVNFRMAFNKDQRSIHPTVTLGTPLELTPHPERIHRVAFQETEEGQVTAVLTDANHLYLAKIQEAEGLFAMEGESEVLHAQIKHANVSSITTLVLDSMGENLLAGTQDGHLLHWDLRNFEDPRLMGSYSVGHTITALSYLIGDRSIVVGTSEGEVEVWMPTIDPNIGGDPKLEKIREFPSHHSAITVISPSQRDKGFITGDRSGKFSLHYSTSGETLLEIDDTGVPIGALMFSPKADGGVFLTQNGQLSVYHLDNQHPEATFSSLFSEVLYEGYQEALHIWQSTGGSDSFEPKFGLWPLMFGTLKGTFYAMILATPLAVLGAVYTAMFMTPDLRSVVKPTVEIMAAFPTVVLGFLAGLWFAPLLEKIFPAVSAIFMVVPVAIILASFGWHFFPTKGQKTSGQFLELLILLLLISASVWICLHFNTEIEAWLYGSDYKQWLSDTFGVGYDQRNALVIAFAMGIAVIPTIFSISEDSISNVPRHLIAGSLALGATPWQTLSKLVIVSASPGIFSALMIGLGRVVGETMIVLMATGNTPLMDLNLFNGFRTLSANIAVEMPEAPHGGTLYRLLFMAGLILFIFTSFVNTIAEVIRQRLRARYSQF
ncbi:ABC transporter permease subunit [Candidatus Nitronereus thalassa]|uniref:ABC transporter permease subunit n=1 Tax=Candidatus Nitronereus thalassa TaxID=3020898 RepID=A0ABU3KA28_9BACT|nr:ABC transporter permease subunit [Candidatus Nitronereus thalassa]MDT7043179.1 ABC transporter permease subunit [Candidatus Nitronereus thalassa]